MRKVAKKVCKLSLFSQLSAPIKSGVSGNSTYASPQLPESCGISGQRPNCPLYIPSDSTILGCVLCCAVSFLNLLGGCCWKCRGMRGHRKNHPESPGKNHVTYPRKAVPVITGYGLSTSLITFVSICPETS